MTTIMVVTMIALLLLGFPMMVPLIAAAVIGFYMMFNGFGQMDTLIQQMMAGIRPASLIAVPMFILAADIMTRGQSANRLIDMGLYRQYQGRACGEYGGVRCSGPSPALLRRPW